MPEARARGYRPGRFSFNVKGGRCEACQGDGVRRVEMHFLPDVFVPCEACHGRRYNRETLEVLYRGKSIADVLDLSVDAARDLLLGAPAARAPARHAERGRASATCGSARARRRSRAARRSGCGSRASWAGARPAARSTSSTSPRRACTSTTCAGCSTCSARLVDAGNTVVVIEHNLDVVKSRRLGHRPRARRRASEGGRVVASGTPEDVARSRKSHTARYLRPLLAPTRRRRLTVVAPAATLAAAAWPASHSRGRRQPA